jgi:hypothetical protein
MSDNVYCLGCGAAFPIDADPYPLNGGMCPPCVAEGRQRPWQIIAENDRLRAEKDTAYAERNAVVLAFARAAVRLGWRVGVLDDPAEPDWPVLVIDLPFMRERQVSWHMQRSELRAGEFDPYPGEWDGHTTPEKYDRLAKIGVRDDAR